MSLQRIKGQEVFIAIVVDGALQTRIDTIQSADIEFELDQLDEGYLGEKSQRYDSIFNGVSISIEGHATNQEFLELAKAIVDRAQRRAGGAARIDVTASFAFPNGDFPSVLLSDVFFESVPVSTGARDEYVSFTLSGKTGTFEIL